MLATFSGIKWSLINLQITIERKLEASCRENLCTQKKKAPCPDELLVRAQIGV